MKSRLQLLAGALALFTLMPAAFAGAFSLGGGQSFTPSVTGTTLAAVPPADSSIGLTDFTFAFNSLGSVPVDLYISTTLPSDVADVVGAAFASSLGDYTDNPSNAAFGNLATRTYHFASAVTLDTDLVYYALFSPGADEDVLSVNFSDTYAGGRYVDYVNGAFPNTTSDFDTHFYATFTAIPEPSSYAALAGLVMLGTALRRRRVG